jgi:endonuclease-3
MSVLRLLDLVTDKDAAAGEVPGLERAIAKSKGVEFGSLLHQFGADFSTNPYSPATRGILLEISPEVQNRLPKRRVEPQSRKKSAEQPAAEPASGGKTSAAKPGQGLEKAGARKKTPPTPAATPDPATKKTKKKSASTPGTPAEPAEKLPARESPSTKKKSVSEGLSKRKPR